MKDFTRSGLVLKVYRQNLRMTQRQFAKYLGGMNSQYVSNWERSLCLPPTDKMATLLRIKNFPSYDFVNALKEDLIESHMRKYEPVKGRRLKNGFKAKPGQIRDLCK